MFQSAINLGCGLGADVLPADRSDSDIKKSWSDGSISQLLIGFGIQTQTVKRMWLMPLADRGVRGVTWAERPPELSLVWFIVWFQTEMLWLYR